MLKIKWEKENEENIEDKNIFQNIRRKISPRIKRGLWFVLFFYFFRKCVTHPRVNPTCNRAIWFWNCEGKIVVDRAFIIESEPDKRILSILNDFSLSRENAFPQQDFVLIASQDLRWRQNDKTNCCKSSTHSYFSFSSVIFFQQNYYK